MARILSLVEGSRPQRLRGVISESRFDTNWNSAGAVTHMEAEDPKIRAGDIVA